MTLIFGYKHVNGVPNCPCNDPGNYMRCEQPTDDPLKVKFVCWCGSSLNCTFDNEEERKEFFEKC